MDVTLINAIPDAEFELYCERLDAVTQAAAVAANAAFVRALSRAVARGKETAVPGTFVDTTLPLGARRYSPEPQCSPCGSPAAMCTAAVTPARR